jgi:alpha-1,2-mannosyltransferase
MFVEPGSERLRFWFRALLATYIAFLVIGWARGFAPGFWDFWGFVAAGRLAADGHPAAAYDWRNIKQLVDAGHPSGEAYPIFFYPPMVLLILAPLALLPPAAAIVLWIGASLAAYVAAIRALLPPALLAALAVPTVLYNLMAGQNGLLTASLFAGALLNLDARPFLAGILTGLLIYKPQFGVLLPFFLILTRRWRVFAAAALTSLALVAASAWLFGLGVFAAFFEQIPGFFGEADAERPHWDNLASLYAMLRVLGVGGRWAWAAQLVVAGTAAVAALRLAAGKADDDLKAAVLVTAALIVTPYSQLYDLVVLVVPMAFVLRRGSALPPWQGAALAAAYLVPLSFLLLPLADLGFRNIAWFAGPLMYGLLAAIVYSQARLSGSRPSRYWPTVS